MNFSKKLDRLLKKNLSNYESLFSNSEAFVQNFIFQDFIDFLTAIDTSFEASELKTQQAERSLEISSRELAESNVKLFNMNNTMNTILNSLQEGLVLFDNTGLCSKFSSVASNKHFNCDFQNQDIVFTELFNVTDSIKEEITDWIQLIFSEKFSFQEIHELGPNWVVTKNSQKIEIQYQPLYDTKNKIEKILVITKDVTSEFQAKNEADNQKNIAKTIIEICESPKLFNDMLETVQLINSNLKTFVNEHMKNWNSEHDEFFRRQIHTIKGATSSFNLKAIVEKIHNYETQYCETESTENKIDLAFEIINYIELSCQLIYKQFGHILTKLLNQQMDQAEDTENLKKQFLTELIDYNNLELLKSFKEKFILTVFTDLFKPFDSVIEKLSAKLDKKISPIQITSETIFVYSPAYKDFFSSLIHVFRNICDHGIEPAEERIYLSKPENGIITVSSYLKNDYIYLYISDDGKGIDKEKLIKKISGTPLEKKYIDSNKILNCIFEPQVSTKEVVTELSGRGVGLNAVLESVKSLNGSVAVTSVLGHGTTFEFIIPLINSVGNLEIQNTQKLSFKKSS